MKEVIITSVFFDLTRKTKFFERVLLVQVQQFGTSTSYGLKFYTSVARGLKLKVRKFFAAISYICRSYRRKTGCRPFRPYPILKRVD